MMTKRDFIKKTAAATGAASAAGFIRPALATSALATVSPLHAPASVGAVVYDDRLPDTRAFAFEFAQRGVMPLDIAAGAEALWTGPLRALLKERPKARIAGLTTAEDFAALQKLGAGKSLATLYEGTHHFVATRMTSRIVHAGPKAHDFLWMLREAGADWQPTLAHTILTARLAGPGRQNERVVTMGARTANGADTLVSWVIG